MLVAVLISLISQVACKLGDGHTSRIARAVAAKLEHVEKTEEIEDLIISLDSNALHAVFLSCITTNLNPDILPVIKDWPARMQQVRLSPHTYNITSQLIAPCFKTPLRDAARQWPKGTHSKHHSRLGLPRPSPLPFAGLLQVACRHHQIHLYL